jgi:hypothetical protein
MGIKGGRHLRLMTSPPSVSRMFTQSGILEALQPYRPPWPVTETALLFLLVTFKLACILSM